MSAALDNIRESINSSRSAEVAAAGLFERAVLQLIEIPKHEDLKPSIYLRDRYPYLSYSAFQRESLETNTESSFQSPIRTLQVNLRLDKDTTAERLGRKIAAFQVAKKQLVDRLLNEAAPRTNGAIEFDICGPVNIEFTRPTVKFTDDPAFRRREALVRFSMRVIFFSADKVLLE